jgi:hypothetical protein
MAKNRERVKRSSEDHRFIPHLSESQSYVAALGNSRGIPEHAAYVLQLLEAAFPQE